MVVISVRDGRSCCLLQVSKKPSNATESRSPVSDAYVNTMAYMSYHYDMYSNWITFIKMNSAIW
jgi:hypothetical protein